ncbi:MAG: hypothetical protein ACYS0G_14040 [Planctomycetota bacterium]|jgi:hypothetical protein
MQQPRQTLLLPRGLILLASAWLVASWIIAIGVRAPVEASSASYTPGVRLMLICVATGLMIGWPLLRLSHVATPFPLRQTLLDLVVLLALVQVVVWPLRLVTPWSPARTAAVDATLAGWTLLAGATVASAVGSDRSGPRNLAALACVCMCLAGPALAWLSAVFGLPLERKLLELGPLMEIHALTRSGRGSAGAEEWLWIGSVAVAGIAAWCGLSAVLHARRQRAEDSAQ